MFWGWFSCITNRARIQLLFFLLLLRQWRWTRRRRWYLVVGRGTRGAGTMPRHTQTPTYSLWVRAKSAQDRFCHRELTGHSTPLGTYEFKRKLCKLHDKRIRLARQVGFQVTTQSRQQVRPYLGGKPNYLALKNADLVGLKVSRGRPNWLKTSTFICR